MAAFVRQDEIRHHLAGLRGVFAGVVLFQPVHEDIDGLLKVRTELSHRIGKGLQSLGQRCVHVPGLDEGLLEQL